jgi:hypothetical protein
MEQRFVLFVYYKGVAPMEPGTCNYEKFLLQQKQNNPLTYKQ